MFPGALTLHRIEISIGSSYKGIVTGTGAAVITGESEQVESTMGEKGDQPSDLEEGNASNVASDSDDKAGGCIEPGIWGSTRAEEPEVTGLRNLTQAESSNPRIEVPIATRGVSISRADGPAGQPRSSADTVFVALGSNVGDRLEAIEAACRSIDQDANMQVRSTSCLYETEPMYVEDQARFLNGVCEVSRRHACVLQSDSMLT